MYTTIPTAIRHSAMPVAQQSRYPARSSSGQEAVLWRGGRTTRRPAGGDVSSGVAVLMP